MELPKTNFLDSPAQPVKPWAPPGSFRLWVGVSFVSLTLCAGWALWQSRQTAQLMAEAEAEAKVATLERYVYSSVQEVSSALQGFASGYRRHAAGGSLAAITEQLKETRKRLPDYVELSVADDQGRVLVATGGAAISPARLPDNAVFQAVRVQTGMVIAEPVLTADTQQLVMPLALRLEDAQGEFRGAILAGVQMRYLRTTLAAMNVGTLGAVSLLGPKGEIYARNPEPRLPDGSVLRQIKSAPMTQWLATGLPTGGYQAKGVVDGVERIYRFKKVGDFPLLVSVGLAISDYLASWAYLAVTAGLLWLAGAGFSFHLYRRWTRSQSQLQVTARQLQDQGVYLQMLGQQSTVPQLLLEVETWQILAGNQAAYQLLQTSPGPLLGQCLLSYFPQAEQDGLKQWAEQALRNQEPVQGALACHLGEGPIRHFDTRWVVLPTPQGIRLHTAWLEVTERVVAESFLKEQQMRLSDLVAERTQTLEQTNRALQEEIAERQKTEKALRESAERLHLHLEYSPLAVVRWSPQFSVVEWAGAAEQVFGWTKEEAVGQCPEELNFVYPEDLSAVSRIYIRLLSGNERYVVSHNRNVHKDGRILHCVWHNTVLVDEQGHISSIMSLVLDVTREAEANAELAKAKEAADAANRAKSLFLAGMSHELRTPMNAIIGLTMAMTRAARTERERAQLGKVMASSEHLLALLNDILDMSKIEAGRLELDEADFSLKQLLAEAEILIGPLAETKGLRLTLSELPAVDWVRGDALRLRQALLNYLSNAVKFTTQGSISVRCRVLEEAGRRVLVRFEVEDSGIGIAEADHNKLFNAFQQLNGDQTTRVRGTGLGLHITNRLAKAMGGETGVSSTPGRGSCFWLTAWLKAGASLPQLVSEVSVADSESELKARFSGCRVLVVEDEPLNQEVALLALEETGLVVEVASNGREALQKAQTVQYDVILMDVHMPEMGGLEATRRLRQLPAYGQTPILAMTANAFSEDREQCFDAGMTGFIPKPFLPEELYVALLQGLTKPCVTASRALIEAPPG